MHKKGTHMTRQPRTLYHARISYHWFAPHTRILDESHSYDLADTVDAMMAHTRHYPAHLGYTCTFDENKLTYTITKFSNLFAVISIQSTDDGIDLL
jgi:hypothetical protein